MEMDYMYKEKFFLEEINLFLILRTFLENP